MSTKQYEVVAKTRTRMGASTDFVPKGTVGVGTKYRSTHDKIERWEIRWEGRYGIGAHSLNDIRVLR